MVPRFGLLCALVACSSNKPRAVEDAATKRGDATPAIAIDAAPPTSPTSAKTGDLQIRVEWKNVPVAMRASPGRTACKTARAPVVAPTTTWGVPDVVVVVANVEVPSTTKRIVLADCALAPRLVAARELVVESAVAEPARITFAKRGEVGTLDAIEKGAPRTIQFPIAGHAVTLPLEANGVYELAAGTETAWIVASPNAGVTDSSGQLVVRDLAPGKYDVTAWLPPRSGGAAKLVRGSVTVVAGDLADLTLELK